LGVGEEERPLIRERRNIQGFEEAGGGMDAKERVAAHEEIKKLRKPIHNVNVKHRESLTSLERFAVQVTDHVGSMGFFIIIFVWTMVWLGWNTTAPKDLRFDPYPAFVLWLFASNVLQIFLMPLIMIGQNLQGRHAEKRAEADFEVNVRAEKEIEVILLHLEHQNELILRILENIEKGRAS
jgi:uncharacterized membrane protein